MARSLALLFLVRCLSAQSPDPSLTQTLINEIRGLRQDLESTNITSQRVQIALYRLQSQTAIVNTAQQRLDSVRMRLLDVQSQRKNLAANLQVADDRIRNLSDAAQKKAMEDELPQAKARLESLAAEEAGVQNSTTDAEAQLRAEKARLSDLQSLLDRLDKALDELARPKR